MSSELFHKQNKTEDHNNGEDRGKEQAGLQVASEGIGNSSDHSRAYGCTEIARECKKCKHRRAALRAFLRGNTDRSRPHNADRQSAKRTSDKTYYREGG